MTDWKEKYEGLIRQLNEDGGLGVYPMGHMSREERDVDALKKTDAYRCGWNDCLFATGDRLGKIMQRAEDGISDDMSMLLASGECFSGDDGKLSLNMNDTWSWALAWCPEVEPDQLPEVARLFRLYGRAGLMYWHSCQEKNMRSEFHDNNRAIDFVRHEEAVCKETTDSNKRAYRQVTYILGLPEKPTCGASRDEDCR